MGSIGQDTSGDDQTIDLVRMIFAGIHDDVVLPDPVKTTLGYLHAPYLKAALADSTILEDMQHPAPRLLGALASVGSRWVNPDGESQFKVFPKIESVVQRVLDAFQAEAGSCGNDLFTSLLLEVLEFCQKLERNVSLMERRVREKAEGEDRLLQVKCRVLQEVRRCIQGYPLPEPVLLLLLYPWSDYLTFTLLRHGEHSALWQEGIDAVADAAWSVQAKSDITERNRLILIQESLYMRIQSGLETIAYDQAKISKLLELLQHFQVMALQNLDIPVLSEERRAELEADAIARLASDTSETSPLSAAEQEIIDAIHHAGFSGWLEFSLIDSHTNLRARVVWANKETSKYMLVDRAGKPVAMKGGREIAGMILAGKGRIVVETGKPLLEQVLETVYASLGNSVAHPQNGNSRMETNDKENFVSRRKHARHSLRDGARVFDLVSGQPVGSIANLSLEGLMLVNSKPLDKDGVYRLGVTIDEGIAFAGQSRDITLGVDCLWTSPPLSAEVSTYWSGCQIVDISEEDFALVEQLIEELAVADGRN